MPDVIGIDHVYIAVADLAESESFYDQLLLEILGFRKKSFELSGEPHIQYFNRHFGYVIRPAKTSKQAEAGTPGLHHFCFRVDSIEEVKSVSEQLRKLGISATEAKNYQEYAPDYWATFFSDPDGVALEVTNFRVERRLRYEDWENQG
ncbi:MAG: VOC family protein [Chromatiaceae bacterium]|nr:VOC family protein [Chromatiaceae bacterium]